jgi:hypothetical protein
MKGFPKIRFELDHLALKLREDTLMIGLGVLRLRTHISYSARNLGV